MKIEYFVLLTKKFHIEIFIMNNMHCIFDESFLFCNTSSWGFHTLLRIKGIDIYVPESTFGSLVHLTSRVHHTLLSISVFFISSNSISFCSENVRIMLDIDCCYEHKCCVQSAFVELINYGNTYISISKAKLQRKYVRTKQSLGYEIFYS